MSWLSCSSFKAASAPTPLPPAPPPPPPPKQLDHPDQPVPEADDRTAHRKEKRKEKRGKEKRDKERRKHGSHKEKERKRQPFNAKINEQSLAKATLFRQKQEATMRANHQNLESLEYLAAEEIAEEEEDGADLGLDQEGQSALDMLGEAENAQDDIAAKLDAE